MISAPAALISLLAVALLASFWLGMFRIMLADTEFSPDARQYWTRMFVLFTVFAAVLYYNARRNS
jgi:hypothetical protein